MFCMFFDNKTRGKNDKYINNRDIYRQKDGGIFKLCKINPLNGALYQQDIGAS